MHQYGADVGVGKGTEAGVKKVQLKPEGWEGAHFCSLSAPPTMVGPGVNFAFLLHQHECDYEQEQKQEKEKEQEQDIGEICIKFIVHFYLAAGKNFLDQHFPPHNIKKKTL